MMEKTIYDLKLHESLEINPTTTVYRVPGHWIYLLKSGHSFKIPYDEEFAPKKPKQKSIIISIKEREQNFKISVIKEGRALHIGDSDLKEFFEYWSEHGDNDKKMKFEKQKSFAIKLRLKNWMKSKNRYSSSQDDKTTQTRNFKA